jgi:hypothetical protein
MKRRWVTHTAMNKHNNRVAFRLDLFPAPQPANKSVSLQQRPPHASYKFTLQRSVRSQKTAGWNIKNQIFSLAVPDKSLEFTTICGPRNTSREKYRSSPFIPPFQPRFSETQTWHTNWKPLDRRQLKLRVVLRHTRSHFSHSNKTWRWANHKNDSPDTLSSLLLSEGYIKWVHTPCSLHSFTFGKEMVPTVSINNYVHRKPEVAEVVGGCNKLSLMPIIRTSSFVPWDLCVFSPTATGALLEGDLQYQCCTVPTSFIQDLQIVILTVISFSTSKI